MSETKVVNKKLDISTEEKIKEAARIVFQKKGFAATRTRDIAEEAGINLALLNYYYRSKKNLFDIIMFETVFAFMQNMGKVLNDEKSTLEGKVEQIATNYIDFISKEPNTPIFMLSELHNNATGLMEKLPIKQLIMDSAFFRQHQVAVQKGVITDPNPLHFLMNLLGMIVFPFIGKPLLKGIGGMNDEQFEKMIMERKKRIPIWIKAMMSA